MNAPATKEAEKPTGLALLRIPFPANQISKLPKPTVKNDVWKTLPRASCAVCGGYHPTTKTIHLDYVGHAALTDRLLDADPQWTWEPLVLGPDGFPALDKDGGMWIKLTVCGVTRLGYGDAGDKEGPNAVKERIGDALRNAAMRFGAALELWHKGELHVEDEGNGKDPGKDLAKAVINAKATPTAGARDNISPEQRAKVDDVVKSCNYFLQMKPPSVADAAAVVDETELSVEEWVYFWIHFDSKQRNAMKTENEARRQRALKRDEATQA